MDAANCATPACRAGVSSRGVIIEWVCDDGHAYICSYDTVEEMIRALNLAHGEELEELRRDKRERDQELHLAQLRKAEQVEVQPEDLVMPFGKYRGERLADILLDYLRWALENMTNLDEVLQEEMENQLALKSGRGVSRRRG